MPFKLHYCDVVSTTLQLLLGIYNKLTDIKHIKRPDHILQYVKRVDEKIM